jgi:hypothetical protein
MVNSFTVKKAELPLEFSKTEQVYNGGYLPVEIKVKDLNPNIGQPPSLIRVQYSPMGFQESSWVDYFYDENSHSYVYEETQNSNTTHPGTYLVELSINDSSYYTTSSNTTLTVLSPPQPEPDLMPPQITLEGGNPIVVIKGSSFSDPKAIVIDNVDEQRLIEGNGSVNTAVPGNYTLTYTASDAAGNAAQSVARTVIVILDPDADEDGDGLKNSVETQTGVFVSAGDTGTDPMVVDTNGDGFSDGEALGGGLNPLTDYSGAIALVKQLSVATPGRFDLYSRSAMMDLNLGGLTIEKQGSVGILRLQIQASSDLNTQPFTNLGAPEEMHIQMPGNKSFFRVHALGTQ